VRVGLVCPYAWDVPGGVQAHVYDLAETLLAMKHQVSVFAPVENDDAELPPYVVSAGGILKVPYNGSVARLAFHPKAAAKVRRWLRDGEFDVLHIHEPVAPSASVLALWAAGREPIVGTFHASMDRSRGLDFWRPALQPALEKIVARIAVSPAARRYIVEHVGGGVILIPNGVSVARFANGDRLPGWPAGAAGTGGGDIGFLGRIDESRKGLPVLLAAFERLLGSRPAARLLVAGPGDVDEVSAELAPHVRERVHFLGRVSEEDKARAYRSVDVFCAPNVGGESFGIVLLEAMAAGAPIVASDLDAFRRVLDDGEAGELFPVEDDVACADALDRVLADPLRRAALRDRGSAAVRRYDWPVVAEAIVHVYETVAAGAPAGVR
jgi:phosphatidylinositol alpha-mannosyltransferase